ncbi:MAG: hypothetical protein AUG44_05135 [Actinobacteria bacterium 13_1_20CM_3_71_11]|nr:MAG: hypothetical protein AUG44_05135 [Actinobacteria bacterium 13_1_20CM_3_71_11]
MQGVLLLADPVPAEPDVPDGRAVLDRDQVLGVGRPAHAVPVPVGPAGGLHGVEDVGRNDARVRLLPALDVDPHDVFRIVQCRCPYGEHGPSVTVRGTG